MVAIAGIGGPAEPRPARGPERRDQKSAKQGPPAQDGVSISSEAREAAESARLANLDTKQSELNLARIEEAKAKLREGTYRVQDVVTEVASRLTRFL